MSVAQPVKTPYQPFQCLICQSRFTRHENLKRHALLHTRSQGEGALPCDYCEATFSRPDLRNRHMKRKHPEQEQEQRRANKKTRRSPAKRVSPAESPDFEASPAVMHEWQDEAYHHDTPRLEGNVNVMDLNSLLDNFQPEENFSGFYEHAQDTPSPIQNWVPSAAQVSQGCELFFTHVSPFLPFLHTPTFSPEQAPSHLILSILSLGYQYGPDPESNRPDSGPVLSRRCFQHARRTTTTPENHNIATVQSYLLLQICAMLYLCGADSAHGLKMHSITIPLARTVGLMQPMPLESATTQDLDTLWHAFVAAESHKRTLFALHQIDALWYQFLSIPRSVSHLEIKHDLPCPEEHWSAVSASEWAHRQLITRQGPGPAVQYADAVRRFLSQDPELVSTIPAFDPYGAINIAQFLISSAREISGWSAMTGMLSIDRFGALRSSLVTLNPFICPDTTTDNSGSPSSFASSSPLCAATWHTAMIELQIWSPSHTSGIVQGSLDAVLNQSTYLSPSGEILCEDITVAAIQGHVDWFLRYLDDTVQPRGEAPWVALYAYKAFLIAWQLVKGKLPGAMAVVGVQDGDVQGAVRWARDVFGRRGRWVLGRLILESLEQL
ncbi:fungal-specific transcription factor domain-containing protein [Aspergillus pseudoustus]|uniref:Fungal-specific transcription factor domain-containing protein n=1 Tax=Aspergillus pseudoustus TaxID=1810923 RepID=A0ABR4IGQ9_9EURO